MDNIVPYRMALNRLHSWVWERVASYNGSFDDTRIIEDNIGMAEWFMRDGVRMFKSDTGFIRQSEKMGDDYDLYVKVGSDG